MPRRRVHTWLVAPALALAACGPVPAPGATDAPHLALRFSLARQAAEPLAQPAETPRSAVVAGPSPRSSPLSVAPSVAPAPSASPARRGGAGGRTSGAASGLVVDQFEAPVAGAEVRFADGSSATSDANGLFPVPARAGLDAVSVSRVGYVGSVVRGLRSLPTLHLRRLEAETAPFDRAALRVAGTVAWPDADHQGGVAYYYDTLGGLAAPAAVDALGRFALTAEPVRGGTARAAILVLAQNAAGETLMGLTDPFTPQDGLTLGPVAMAAATTAWAFAADQVDPALTVQASRLEIQPSGMPPIVLDGTSGIAGAFRAPPDGHLPGPLRVVIEATSPDGLGTTVVSQRGGGGASVQALALPAVAIDAAARRVSWTAVQDAKGYRLAVRRLGGPQDDWEAWSPTATALEVPAERWPAPGLGEVVVEAVDAPSLDSRTLASLDARPCKLRLAPWTDAAAYRLARRRVPL